LKGAAMNEPDERVENGFDVPICAKNGDETDIVMRIVIGNDAGQEIGEQKRRGQDDIKKLEETNRPERLNKRGFRGFRPTAQQPVESCSMSEEEIDRNLIKLLAAFTVSWKNILFGGKQLQCNRENAVMLYTRFPWIKEQVKDAVNDNFGLEDILASPAFQKSEYIAAQAGRRHWGPWNRHFAEGNFELAARAMAEDPSSDSPLATPEHELRLRGHRTLPLWKGQSVKNLAVIFSDGYGDALLFGRYLHTLCERAGRVTAIVPKPLRELFEKNTPPEVDVFDFMHCSGGLKSADAHMYPAFLPHESGQGYGEAAWITSESSKREPIPGVPVRVGINWMGATENPHNRLRSIPPARLAPLFDVPGIEWHSLQADRRAIAPESVIDHAPELHSFLDTTNLIATLDLVISIDSSVANLAGSMGRPLWALLEPPAYSDFRWSAAADLTPWFPSARVFRQGNDHKWNRVIRHVADALVELKAKRELDAIRESDHGHD
jgi:hypothetical protein